MEKKKEVLSYLVPGTIVFSTQYLINASKYIFFYLAAWIAGSFPSASCAGPGGCGTHAGMDGRDN